MMEKLAQKIAEYIGSNLEFDDEKQRVVAYGLSALFQMIIIFTVITIIGVLLRFYPEAFVLFLGVGLLRKSTGGNHAPTFNSCLFISIGSILLLAALAHQVPVGRNVGLYLIFSILSYLLVFVLVYRHAPVDSPNKPIKNAQKNKRLRRNSFFTVTIYMILTVVCISSGIKIPTLFHMGISLTLSSIWQALTLTKWSKGFFILLSFSNGDIGEKK